MYSPVRFSIYRFSTTEHFVLQVKLFYSYKLDNRLIFKGKKAEIADKGDEITEKTASQTHTCMHQCTPIQQICSVPVANFANTTYKPADTHV